MFIEIFFVKSFPFGSSPSRHMNSVSNIAYMEFFREITLPDRVKHLLAYFAMKPAYTVDVLACIASKDRHTESLL